MMVVMKKSDLEDERVFSVVCPDCGSRLWIDSETKTVLRKEKPSRRPGLSLDSLMEKEKRKKETLPGKMDAAWELKEKKKAEAEEAFLRLLQERGEEE
ncbi:MAG: hypothetical protein BWY86_01475 [Candidatus Aminicenantes bacterium ADurb.Bin508]|nr:MAG: hypothetical protein BWY86_01475 [Candidatus Aminicenantes bacterium ADurb.Bin508]